MSEKLAPGAPPSEGFIPLIVPEIGGNEWKYVKDCLDTNWVSSVGSYVDRFERLVAERAGARFAVATVNGTAALHVALLLCGVERDDEVIVSDLTFIAPANAVRYVGAWPVFIDAEPVHWQMDPNLLERFLKDGCRAENGTLFNRKTGRRVRAVLPVHILGHPVDLDAVRTLAKNHGLPVIEDATEGLGALYKGRSIGGVGDLGCFSFNGNKIITTGGGGMLVTNNEVFAARARHLTTQAKADPLEYVHDEVGYNYRLTNMLAAMGCAQLECLDGFVRAKQTIAARYRAGFAGVPGIQTPKTADWAVPTFWMYTVLVDPAAGIDSRTLLRKLSRQKIQTRPLWQPMHRSPAHESAGSPPCPVSESLCERALSLPCSAGLSESAQNQVIEAVRQALSEPEA